MFDDLIEEKVQEKVDTELKTMLSEEGAFSAELTRLIDQRLKALFSAGEPVVKTAHAGPGRGRKEGRLTRSFPPSLEEGPYSSGSKVFQGNFPLICPTRWTPTSLWWRKRNRTDSVSFSPDIAPYRFSRQKGGGTCLAVLPPPEMPSSTCYGLLSLPPNPPRLRFVNSLTWYGAHGNSAIPFTVGGVPWIP